MRARRLLPLLLVALVAIAPAQSAPVQAKPTLILITKDGFSPGAVSIKAGQAVTWHNVDATGPRQVVSQSAGFTSPLLQPDQVFTFTFNKVGSFGFRDATRASMNGVVNVGFSAAAAAVTQSVSSRTVVYGSKVRLSGQVSSRRAGETVTVFAKAYGRPAKAAGAVLTRAGGKWSYTVRPKIQTRYQTRWITGGKALTSRPATIGVRPQLLLTVRSSSGRTVTFTTRARADRSLGGKPVTFQRRTSFGQWVIMRQVRLGSGSSATFSVTLPGGRSTVRTVMPAQATGPGYLAAVSRPLGLSR